MIFTSIQPSAHLRDYIKVFMLIHYRFSQTAPAPIKPFVSSPNQGITFYPRGFLRAQQPDSNTSVLRPQTVIFGQHVSRLNLCLCQDEFIMFDVSFQPGVLSKFLRSPLGEFVNQNIDAEAVIGSEIRLVNDQLAHANSYQHMVTIVENYLWRKIQKLQIDLLPLEKASRMMLAKNALWSLDQWADHSCLSISQFERRFRTLMGVSPKLFARVIRFDKAFQLKETSPEIDWLSIALQTGYTDYQHMVKDFKQFAGATPNIIIQQDANAPERLLGLV